MSLAEETAGRGEGGEAERERDSDNEIRLKFNRKREKRVPGGEKEGADCVGGNSTCTCCELGDAKEPLTKEEAPCSAKETDEESSLCVLPVTEPDQGTPGS